MVMFLPSIYQFHLAESLDLYFGFLLDSFLSLRGKSSNLLGPISCFTLFLGITLLEFKRTLNDSKNYLSDWNDYDESPCKWTGISCHPKDQNVIAMYVTSSRFNFWIVFIFFHFPLISYLHVSLCPFCRNLPYMQLGGIISPSIGRLSRLQRL